MKIKYILSQDIVARLATNLALNLSELKSNIRIYNNDKDVNGKSLLGILTANIKMNDNITILFDQENEMNKIKEIFNELGREI